MRIVSILALLVFSIFLAMFGVHDIDNAWNLKYINQNYDPTLIDCGSDACYSADEAYLKGLMEVEFGVFLVFLSSLMLGYYSARKL